MNAHFRHLATPEEARLRERIETAIEGMLALLDELEGDTDREADFSDWEPGNDDEPSLGWIGPGAVISCHGGCDDLEHDIADLPHGPDTDREHTAPEGHGMGFVYAGPDDAEDGHDAEEDPAEAGICDGSEAIEQQPVFIGREPI